MQDFPDVELLRALPFSWLNWLKSIGILIAATVVYLFGFLDALYPKGQDIGAALTTLGIFVICVVEIHRRLLADRDVILSVEGIRKGKGARSTFIPWQGANVQYLWGDDRCTVAANGKRVRLRDWNFDKARFQEIMQHLVDIAAEQSFPRHASSGEIATPIYSLSDQDKAEFVGLRGSFFAGFTLSLILLAISAMCIFYMTMVFLILFPQPDHRLRAMADAVFKLAPGLFDNRRVVLLGIGAFLILYAIVADAIGSIGHRRELKKERTEWLQNYDGAQVTSISELGVLDRESGGHAFYGWTEITIVSTPTQILFTLPFRIGAAFIVPKRLFPTPKEAAAFYHHAVAYKRASAGRPNLFEPVSFWEIA